MTSQLASLVAVHFCTEVAVLFQYCSKNVALINGKGKITLCGESNWKTAALMAIKHSRDDSNSSDEEIHALEHVSGSNHDCDSATKAKHRSQV